MKAWKKMMAFCLAVLLLVVAPAAFATEEDLLDTAKLEELLEIADCAQKSHYTAESWQALEEAVAYANEAISSGSQLKINNAVSLLATALSQLTSMDYSQLDPVVEEAELYIHATFDEWIALFKMLVDHQNLYGSGDQEAVDRSAEEIRQFLDILQGKVVPPQSDATRPTQPDSSQSDVQKPEEKSPVVWIALLGVSALCNVVLLVVMVLPKMGRKKDHVDDVPLVDYDIDDDVV